MSGSISFQNIIVSTFASSLTCAYAILMLLWKCLLKQPLSIKHAEGQEESHHSGEGVKLQAQQEQIEVNLQTQQTQ